MLHHYFSQDQDMRWCCEAWINFLIFFWFCMNFLFVCNAIAQKLRRVVKEKCTKEDHHKKSYLYIRIDSGPCIITQIFNRKPACGAKCAFYGKENKFLVFINKRSYTFVPFLLIIDQVCSCVVHCTLVYLEYFIIGI